MRLNFSASVRSTGRTPSNLPIRAALRRAVDADQEASGISPNDLDAGHDTPRVAASVAAFLRALAEQHRDEVAGDVMGVAGWLNTVARDVEACA